MCSLSVASESSYCHCVIYYQQGMPHSSLSSSPNQGNLSLCLSSSRGNVTFLVAVE